MEEVNHPRHYTVQQFKMQDFECINVSAYLPFCLGNAFKYVYRCGYKNDSVQDLQKALWYLKYSLKHFGMCNKHETAQAMFSLIDEPNCDDESVVYDKWSILKYIVYDYPNEAIAEIEQLIDKIKA